MDETHKHILDTYGHTKKVRIRHDYFNSSDFKDKHRAYMVKYNDAKSQGKQTPVVPNDLARQIMLISENMAKRANFSGYPFIEDMILDGNMAAIRCVHNYDESTGYSPFAYFSTVIWRAFVKRIGIEKRELYLKCKATVNAVASHSTYDSADEISSLYNAETMDYVSQYVEDYESSAAKKKVSDEQE